MVVLGLISGLVDFSIDLLKMGFRSLPIRTSVWCSLAGGCFCQKHITSMKKNDLAARRRELDYECSVQRPTHDHFS